MDVRPYTRSDAGDWDDLVARSWNGTFLLTRGYLSFADERFDDRSVLVCVRGRTVAVFPATVHASDPEMIESHPAVGYGGLVHDGVLRGARMLEAVEAVAERYFHDGMATVRYKPVPQVYHRIPSADDLYALFRLGATRSRCDLASVVDVRARGPLEQRRARGLRKAERAGVRVERGTEHLERLWPVVVDRLASKHAAEPIHDLGDLVRLAGAFPRAVDCLVAILGDDVVAGIVRFRTGAVDHAQYIAADDRGYATSALDAVLRRALDDAAADGVRYVSLGNSTLYGGRVFNEGLFAYKAGFGAGTVVHEAYDLALA